MTAAPLAMRGRPMVDFCDKLFLAQSHDATHEAGARAEELKQRVTHHQLVHSMTVECFYCFARNNLVCIVASNHTEKICTHKDKEKTI